MDRLLVENEFNEAPEFRIAELSSDDIISPVLEDTEVEVLIHHRTQ